MTPRDEADLPTDATTPDNAPDPTGLLASWTRTTFAGWCLGFALALLAIAVSGVVGLGDTQFPVGLGMGLGVGLIQARRLARTTELRRGWTLATVAGVTAPQLAFDIAQRVIGDLPWSLPAVVVAGGLIAGVLQAHLLRRLTRRAALWIPASLLGWAAGAATVAVPWQSMPLPGIAGALLYVAILLSGGVLLGLVTGVALTSLLRDRPITPGPAARPASA